MERRESLLDAARRSLRQLGLQVRQTVDPEFDLVAQRGTQRFIVEVKEIRPYRRTDARGRAADGVLRLREATKASKARPLLAVEFERLTAGALEDLANYLTRYAPDVSWLLFDEEGRATLQLVGEGRREVTPPARPARSKTPRPVNPFSPLNQWLLKVLLMGSMSPRFWGGPTGKPSNVSEWARAAGASQPQTSLLASELQRRGLLVRLPNELRPLDVPRLLQAWAAQPQPATVRLKPLYPLASGESPGRWVLERLAEQHTFANRAVIAGPAACQLLDVSVTNVEGLRVYVAPPLEQWLEALQLVSAEAGEPSVEVVVARDLRPYALGAVHHQSLLVGDVLQCYLDSRHAPVRGEEQAAFIWDRILEPHFEGLGWY